MSFSEFSDKDYEIIRRDCEGLLAVARKRCSNDEEMSEVRKALDFACEAHKNVRRRSGEPYIIHPIAVSRIVIENIGLGYKSIIAALLHDVVEDTEYTTEDIRNLFGEKIASLVDGLTKIKTVLDNEDKSKEHVIYSESLQAENFKRILLTLNDDVRVVLIKLADRLHNCRTIEYMPEHKRDKILSETMFIFIPLAHRLGLYEVKSELENIWLRYREPEAYNDLTRRINMDLSSHGKYIDEFMEPISQALEKAGFDFEIRKRVKTPYSIWRKMRDKNVPFEEVYDLYAVRIIFNPSTDSNETERDQCYHIFSIISGIYRYEPSRMRDWVRQPKSNGYEALHCTLMSRSGVWVEVQIRSRRMDDIAEKGIAAHWTYKREGYITEADNEMDKWLAKVKDILVQRDDINAMELLDIIHNDLTSAEIVVFTPKGEQRSIPKGSTALDFAYLIHTDIGNKAIAAKVNMKLVSLSHQLRPGDSVEIITASNSHPQKEWLQFLKTRRAIGIVMDYFRGFSDPLIVEGSTIFRNLLSNMGLRATNENLKKILLFTQLPYVDELYFRLGLGIIRPEELEDILSNKETATAPSSDSFMIRSRDSQGRRYIIASCCCPIPGDPVIGFKSPDGVITVHKKACKIAQGIASKHGDWVVIPEWESTSYDNNFPARIIIRGLDRVGLITDISLIISRKMGVNMRRLSLGANEGIFDGAIEMMVHDKKTLEEMINALETIDGIQTVIRTDV